MKAGRLARVSRLLILGWRMSAWVPFTDETFKNALPVEYLSQHAYWIVSHPSKEFRLTEIVAAVRTRFRAAVSSNPANVLDPDETKVPTAGEEYAFVMAAYKLGLEFGLTSTAIPQGSSVVSLVVMNVPSGGAMPQAQSSAGSAPSGLNFLDQLGQRMARAEIWLRMVQSGIITIAGDGEAGGTPSYQQPEGRCQWSED